MAQRFRVEEYTAKLDPRREKVFAEGKKSTGFTTQTFCCHVQKPGAQPVDLAFHCRVEAKVPATAKHNVNVTGLDVLWVALSDTLIPCKLGDCRHVFLYKRKDGGERVFVGFNRSRVGENQVFDRAHVKADQPCLRIERLRGPDMQLHREHSRVGCLFPILRRLTTSAQCPMNVTLVAGAVYRFSVTFPWEKDTIGDISMDEPIMDKNPEPIGKRVNRILRSKGALSVTSLPPQTQAAFGGLPGAGGYPQQPPQQQAPQVPTTHLASCTH
jgi:hypothetical protein